MPKLSVYLTPALVEPAALSSDLVIVIDILRATTSMLHALAAGADAILPVAEVDQARELARQFPPSAILLAGERKGSPIAGFDLGNSPKEFVPSTVAGKQIIFTTTNGTKALLHAQHARRVLIGAFVNFTAVCQEIAADGGDVVLLCAGTDSSVSLEDTLFAGSVVEHLQNLGSYQLDDGARIAWDTFEGHGSVLLSAFELAEGGRNLQSIGLGEDLAWAARVDRFGIIAELTQNPLRLAVASHLAPVSQWRVGPLR